jgi:hypothetical protein
MFKQNESHRILISTRSWAALLAIVLLVACGNKESDAPTAPRTATSPAEFYGVYQHPPGGEERLRDDRLTITPSGMSLSGYSDSVVSWKSATGDAATGWNFECTEASREFCQQGSLVKTDQGVIASITGGTRPEWFQTAYGG